MKRQKTITQYLRPRTDDSAVGPKPGEVSNGLSKVSSEANKKLDLKVILTRLEDDEDECDDSPRMLLPLPGQTFKKKERDELQGTRKEIIALLDIVWAKLPAYPDWPAIVCFDPCERVYRSRGHIHVQFFDDPPSRSWVPEEGVTLATRSSLVRCRSYSRDTTAEGLITRRRMASKEALVSLDLGPRHRRSLILQPPRIKPKKRSREDPDFIPESSGEDEDISETDTVKDQSEKLSEYELMRLKNIEERNKVLEQLGIAKKGGNTKKAKPAAAPRPLRPQRHQEAVRRSRRLMKVEAEIQGLSTNSSFEGRAMQESPETSELESVVEKCDPMQDMEQYSDDLVGLSNSSALDHDSVKNAEVSPVNSCPDNVNSAENSGSGEVK